MGGDRKTVAAKTTSRQGVDLARTFSEEAQRFRTCSTGIKAMASASPFRMDTVRTRPVLVSMCVLVAEVTTSARVPAVQAGYPCLSYIFVSC